MGDEKEADPPSGGESDGEGEDDPQGKRGKRGKSSKNDRGGEDETREDTEELPKPDDETEVPAPVAAVGRLQDVVYYGIGIILLLLAAAVGVRTVTDFFTAEGDFGHRVTEVVNGVLFVVIIMELLRTVLAHFEDDTFHLKPFIIIGIVSVVRHILTVGAAVSLEEEAGDKLFHRSDIELAVNAVVVLVLVLGLVLVRETE